MATSKVSKPRQRVKPLTQEYIKNILGYNPETGEFRWKWRHDVPPEVNTRWAGKEAGGIELGYRIIGINYIDYRAHILAWCYMTGEWPTNDIDHRDLNRANNIFTNLRKATRSQNIFNSPKKSNNTSGYKGIDFHKGKYWRTRIQVNGKVTTLGYFLNIEDAAKARANALEKYHGEFARIE